MTEETTQEQFKKAVVELNKVAHSTTASAAQVARARQTRDKITKDFIQSKTKSVAERTVKFRDFAKVLEDEIAGLRSIGGPVAVADGLVVLLASVRDVINPPRQPDIVE